MGIFATIISTLWNRLVHAPRTSGLKVGYVVRDGNVTRKEICIPEPKRSEHIAIVGKTGTGKSSLLRYFMSQDVGRTTGFACIDLHGDIIPFVLASIAALERRTGQDLSSRLLLIDPSHPKYSPGLNLIDCSDASSPAVQISEMVNFLKVRWSLDHFGARTEELLRNSLWVLCENNLTLLEISPLLTNSAFRLSLLKRVQNREVKAYFEERFNRSSEAMQKVMSEAVLNKVSSFAVDPAIRHIIGQTNSSVSLKQAIDQGFWILLNLRKASLGDNALTFAGLFLTKLKNAIFTREKRSLFTLYADELPNLVASDDAFVTLLSEARKFSISVVSANQFLNQLSPAMKSALFSVGTSLCFETSSEDAPFMARVLAGENSLIRTLKTLPHRHLVTRLQDSVQEIRVPNVKRPPDDFSNLASRSLIRFAKVRYQIEDEINARKPTPKTQYSLEDWQ